MISVVAKAYGIHPQTLRLYEREGLLKPSRPDGNTRLYSEDDLRQLEVILNLTRDLGTYTEMGRVESRFTTVNTCLNATISMQDNFKT